MTGFAYIQKGTYSVSSGTITLATIPSGSYGTNPAVVIAVVGTGSLATNNREITINGLPSGTLQTSEPADPFGIKGGGTDSTVLSLHAIRDSPAHVPPIVSALDGGAAVVLDSTRTGGSSSGIFWVGVMTFSAGQDARDGSIQSWIPVVSSTSAPPTAWDVTVGHATGTLHNLPFSSGTGFADPWDPTAGGRSSLLADPTFPVAIGCYMGSASSSSPSIPTWTGDPSLVAWQDIDHMQSGSRVISIGLFTRALATGVDSLGRPQGDFDVSNMPGLSHALDAWGIIMVTTGKGTSTVPTTAPFSWVAVIG